MDYVGEEVIMKIYLAASYEKVITKIRTTGGIWEQGSMGWHHCFDKKLVKDRISELEFEIARFKSPS